MVIPKINDGSPIVPPLLLSEDEPLDYLPSDAQPQYTPQEAARDWEILQQYEAEFGPINAPTCPHIDPEDIVSIVGTPMPRIFRRTNELQT